MNLKELVDKYCPNGVKSINIDEICKIETGKLNANSAVKNGKYAFFTTSKIPSKIDKYNWDKEALLISGNADVGSVKYYKGKFNAYQRVYVLSNFEKEISVKYVYFVLTNNLKQYLSNNKNKSAMTYILLNSLKKFKLPVPPLPVQEEIVRILDKFTNLTNELKNELDLRKKQYEYYRDKLLSFDGGGVKWKRLGNICAISRGASPRPIKNYITTNGNGINWIKIGDVALGAKYITECAEKITQEGAKKSRAVKPGDFVISNSMSFGRPYILQIEGCIHDGWLSISEFENFVTADYLYYVLISTYIQRLMKQKASFGGAVQNLNADIVRSIEIPIPPLSVQKEIVEKLDRFNELCNEVTKGLPAEIQMREKQYEYYRDKLLSFEGTQ